MTTRVPPAPGRQRAEALTAAQHARMSLAQERNRIRAMNAGNARRRVQAILSDPNGEFAGSRVGAIITCIPGVGTAILLPRLIRHTGIASADTRVRDLTDRQRDALVYAVGLPHREQLHLVPVAPESEAALRRENEHLRSELLRLRCAIVEQGAV